MRRGQALLALGLAAGLTLVALASAGSIATSAGLPRRARVADLARDGPAMLPTRTPHPEVLACEDILAPVDKQHRLAAECVPPDLVPVPASLSVGAQYLRAVALDAFERMAAAASREGYSLLTNSAYRSYAEQEATFAGWVAILGPEEAERSSARAGHSEHQLGTTLDLCAPTACLDQFTGTPEADWVAWHAWEYGFVVSYPEGKEGITGFVGEPWHIRYVGPEASLGVRNTGLTLHEFLLR